MIKINSHIFNRVRIEQKLYWLTQSSFNFYNYYSYLYEEFLDVITIKPAIHPNVVKPDIK